MFHNNGAIPQNEEWNIKCNRYIQKYHDSGKICCDEQERYGWEKVWVNGLKKWSYAQPKFYSFLNQNKIMIFPGVLVSVIIAVIKHNNKQQIGKERVYLF